MTKVHAYLARIKDQEKEVIAVPDGAGRALCVSSDKHWTLAREWDELHIIAPLVEDEGNDDELDPAVFVVRESDIAAVKVEQDEDGGWEANGDLVAMRQNTAEALRGWALGDLQMLARYEAVARAIEAEQAEDPIMVRTRELLDLAYPGDYAFTGAFETCRKIAEAEARLEAQR